jgi:hypothetical protein
LGTEDKRSKSGPSNGRVVCLCGRAASLAKPQLRANMMRAGTVIEFRRGFNFATNILWRARWATVLSYGWSTGRPGCLAKPCSHAERSSNSAGHPRQLVALVADGSRVDRLKRIVAPTLMIRGADDPRCRSNMGKARLGISPALMIEAGMGHDLPEGLIPSVCIGATRLRCASCARRGYARSCVDLVGRGGASLLTADRTRDRCAAGIAPAACR